MIGDSDLPGRPRPAVSVMRFFTSLPLSRPIVSWPGKWLERPTVAPARQITCTLHGEPSMTPDRVTRPSETTRRRGIHRALSYLLHREPGGSALLLPLRDLSAWQRIHESRLVCRAVVGGREPVRADLDDHAAHQPPDGRQLPLGDDRQRRPDHRGHGSGPAADRGGRCGVPDPDRLPRLHLRREHVGGRSRPGGGGAVPRDRCARGAGNPLLLPLGLRRPVQHLRGRLPPRHRLAVDPGAAACSRSCCRSWPWSS